MLILIYMLLKDNNELNRFFILCVSDGQLFYSMYGATATII